MRYTFKAQNYLEFMPVIATDRGAGRLHYCPICGKKVWSAWGHADKHWQKHGSEDNANRAHIHQP